MAASHNTPRLPDILREIEDEGAVAALCSQIAADLRSCAARLHDSGATPDHQERVLHEIKGIALTLQADHLAALCVAGETLHQQGHKAALELLVPQVTDACAEVAKAVLALAGQTA